MQGPFANGQDPRSGVGTLLACYVLEDTSKKEGKNLIVHSMLQSKSI